MKQSVHTFSCDVADCDRESDDEKQFAHYDVRYRRSDGSSGTHSTDVCADHEDAVHVALVQAGLIPREA